MCNTNLQIACNVVCMLLLAKIEPKLYFLNKFEIILEFSMSNATTRRITITARYKVKACTFSLSILRGDVKIKILPEAFIYNHRDLNKFKNLSFLASPIQRAIVICGFPQMCHNDENTIDSISKAFRVFMRIFSAFWNLHRLRKAEWFVNQRLIIAFAEPVRPRKGLSWTEDLG